VGGSARCRVAGYHDGGLVCVFAYFASVRCSHWTCGVRKRRFASAFASATDNGEVTGALAALRDRADFRLMMMDLAFPAEPFARRG
jgi:hypothetical protein